MSKKIKHITNKFPDRNNPFSAPDGYFQALPDRILDRIEEQEKSTSKSTIIRYLKPILALAASFVIIFLLIYVPVKTIGPSITENDNTVEEMNQDLLPYIVTDEVIYKTFNTDEDQSIDDGVIETVLLASVSDMELMNI